MRAQDEERQRIERNLHDGAQQQLVALMIQLSLLEDAAEDPGEVRQLTGQLRAGLHAALDDLRALARGIYPPLLADQGLGAALRRAGRRGRRCPVRSRPTASGATRGTPRPPCTSASWRRCRTPPSTPGPRQATVALACPDGHLEFTVTDDGAGFDTTAVTRPAGRTGTGCRAWPTGSPPPAAPSASAPRPERAPSSPAGFPSPVRVPGEELIPG